VVTVEEVGMWAPLVAGMLTFFALVRSWEYLREWF
jgi:hypothetical protein